MEIVLAAMLDPCGVGPTVKAVTDMPSNVHVRDANTMETTALLMIAMARC